MLVASILSLPTVHPGMGYQICSLILGYEMRRVMSVPKSQELQLQSEWNKESWCDKARLLPISSHLQHSQAESASDLWAPQAEVKLWVLLPSHVLDDFQHYPIWCSMTLCPWPGPLGNYLEYSPLKVALPTGLQHKFTCSRAIAFWYLFLFLILVDVSLSSSIPPSILLLFSCFTPGDAVIPRFKIRNNRDQKSPQIISPPSWLFPRVPSPNLFSPVPYDFTNRAFSSFL